MLISAISDHLPYFTYLIKPPKHDSKDIFIKTTVSEVDAINKIKNELNSECIYNNLNHELNSDPNPNYNKFICHLMSIKEKYMPIKLVRYNKYRHKKNTWITNSLLKSIKYRDKMYPK